MKPSWPLDARGREGGKKGESERERVEEENTYT